MLTKIGEILIEGKMITQDQLEHCLEYKKTNPRVRIGAILKHHNFINDHILADCLSKQIKWRRFESAYIPDYEVIEAVGLGYFYWTQIPVMQQHTCAIMVRLFGPS